MPDDIFSIVPSGNNLDFLKPVLKSWISLIEKYPYGTYADCPYYYSERMNTGLLGCAALESGLFYPLEEHKIGRNNIGGFKFEAQHLRVTL